MERLEKLIITMTEAPPAPPSPLCLPSTSSVSPWTLEQVSRCSYFSGRGPPSMFSTTIRTTPCSDEEKKTKQVTVAW